MGRIWFQLCLKLACKNVKQYIFKVYSIKLLNLNLINKLNKKAIFVFQGDSLSVDSYKIKHKKKKIIKIGVL